MTFNQAGLDLIKSFESCKLDAYQDLRGIWTIGYGCTGPNIVEGMSINQAMADRMLLDALNGAIRGVTGLLKGIPSDNQFSAMVSLCYNIGLGAFGGSTLLRMVNDGDYSGAADQFLVWDRCDGVVVPGLLRRRQAERSLFILS